MKKHKIKQNAAELLEMRIAGISIKSILEKVDMQESTLRRYYESIGLLDTGIAFEMNIKDLLNRMEKGEACKNCGEFITITKSNKKFCCDECRYIWWNLKRR